MLRVATEQDNVFMLRLPTELTSILCTATLSKLRRDVTKA